MPETDLDLLIRAAREAGDVARRFAGKTAKRWDKPDNAGPVTEADLAVNTHLEEVLGAARPTYGWLSEESEDDDARLNADTVFIVDPIDGTRNFIEGGRTWAHSLAVAKGGRILAGVVYIPMRDMMYAAALGAGATLNEEPMQVRPCDTLDDAEILCNKWSVEPRYWTDEVPAFERAYRPSIAYRMALIGQGRFDGMVTFRRTWEWDIAAGSLIASEAGAVVSDRDGAALQFNCKDPRSRGIVVAASDIHARLIDAHDPDG